MSAALAAFAVTMRRQSRRRILPPVILLATLCVSANAAAQYVPMPDLASARQTLVSELARDNNTDFVYVNLRNGKADPSGYSSWLDYTSNSAAMRGKYAISFTTILTDTIAVSYVPGYLMPGNNYVNPAWKISWTDYFQMHHYYFQWSGWTQADAQSIAWAIRTIALDARNGMQADLDANLAQFKQTCRAWRSLPPMSQDARAHALLAQQAYQAGHIGAAIENYYATLKEYPCWPSGQFNMAMLHGAGHAYPPAINDMKKYLQLLPDAPDAQSAMNDIAEWTADMGH